MVAVGDRPGAIYLSVAPHVEPTHTQYDDDGACLPPTYGVWADAGGAPASSASRAELAQTYRAATQRLLELLQANAAVAERESATTDDLWAALYPVLHQVRVLEDAWNELAYQSRR